MPLLNEIMIFSGQGWLIALQTADRIECHRFHFVPLRFSVIDVRAIIRSLLKSRQFYFPRHNKSFFIRRRINALFDHEIFQPVRDRDGLRMDRNQPAKCNKQYNSYLLHHHLTFLLLTTYSRRMHIVTIPCCIARDDRFNFLPLEENSNCYFPTA